MREITTGGRVMPPVQNKYIYRCMSRVAFELEGGWAVIPTEFGRRYRTDQIITHGSPLLPDFLSFARVRNGIILRSNNHAWVSPRPA